MLLIPVQIAYNNCYNVSSECCMILSHEAGQPLFLLQACYPASFWGSNGQGGGGPLALANAVCHE